MTFRDKTILLLIRDIKRKRPVKRFENRLKLPEKTVFVNFKTVLLDSYDFIRRESVPFNNETILEALKQKLPEINSAYRAVDSYMKQEKLHGILQDGVFYVCSTHADCAQDHLPYQGKLYITEKWKSRVENPDEQDRIARLIEAQDVKTVESVVYDKPYLTTRPYCRHVLKPVSTEKALSGRWRSSIDHTRRSKLMVKLRRYIPSRALDTEIAKKKRKR